MSYNFNNDYYKYLNQTYNSNAQQQQQQQNTNRSELYSYRYPQNYNYQQPASNYYNYYPEANLNDSLYTTPAEYYSYWYPQANQQQQNNINTNNVLGFKLENQNTNSYNILNSINTNKSSSRKNSINEASLNPEPMSNSTQDYDFNKPYAGSVPKNILLPEMIAVASTENKNKKTAKIGRSLTDRISNFKPKINVDVVNSSNPADPANNFKANFKSFADKLAIDLKNKFNKLYKSQNEVVNASFDYNPSQAPLSDDQDKENFSINNDRNMNKEEIEIDLNSSRYLNLDTESEPDTTNATDKKQHEPGEKLYNDSMIEFFNDKSFNSVDSFDKSSYEKFYNENSENYYHNNLNTSKSLTDLNKAKSLSESKEYFNDSSRLKMHLSLSSLAFDVDNAKLSSPISGSTSNEFRPKFNVTFSKSTSKIFFDPKVRPLFFFVQNLNQAV